MFSIAFVAGAIIPTAVPMPVTLGLVGILAQRAVELGVLHQVQLLHHAPQIRGRHEELDLALDGRGVRDQLLHHARDLDDLRVLIMDNASTDDSATIARELAATDSRVELHLRTRNLGPHASFNEGIDWASADYFLILCADDLLAPGALARAVDVMELHREVNLVFGRTAFVAADFAARTMRWTGVIVGLFIIYHVADLTLGWTNPDFEYGLVYNNMVASLGRPAVAVFYVVANLALGVHLYHGAWSLFQSMGWNRRGFNHWRRYFAVAFAAVVVIGNLSFPIAVMTGIVS
jgi:succinate dehydrogenase / fumarate reductase cytochrome b subunit